MIALYILLGFVALVLYLLLGKVAKRLSGLLIATSEVVVRLEWDREQFADTYAATIENFFDDEMQFVKAFWPLGLIAIAIMSAMAIIVGIFKMAWIIIKMTSEMVWAILKFLSLVLWNFLKLLGRIVKWAWK